MSASSAALRRNADEGEKRLCDRSAWIGWCDVIGAIGAQPSRGVTRRVEHTGYFRIIPRFAVTSVVFAGVLVSERKIQPGARVAWDDDEAAGERLERLTPSQAAAFRARKPQAAPW